MTDPPCGWLAGRLGVPAVLNRAFLCLEGNGTAVYGAALMSVGGAGTVAANLAAPGAVVSQPSIE